MIEIEQIRNLWRAGMSPKRIGRLFDIHKSHAYRLATGYWEKTIMVVVKVQAPLSEDSDLCLVYPEGRYPSCVQKVKPDIMAILLQRENRKAYFEAEMPKIGPGFIIGRLVDDQPW